MADTPKAPSTPGSQAIENLKKLDKEIAEFKKPSMVSAKKNKMKILTEEKYIEELSKIIQRDFFPDLDRLRAQNDYLDAMDRKDYAVMEAIRARYTDRRSTDCRGAFTPATFETPASASLSTPRVGGDGADTPKSTTSNASKEPSSAGGGQKELSEKHTLDSFLQAYTSEDNFSFQEIIDTADQKLRQRFAVLYNEEGLSAEKLARALTLPTIEQQFDEPDPMRKIETWTYINKNSIMYTPEGVELTDKERIEGVTRRQVIHHSATRLAASPFDDKNSMKAVSEIARSQSLALNDRIGVDGLAIAASLAPQIRGFDLVKTPSPRPGEAFSPLMTWGEIEGTPFRLDGSDTPVRSNSGPSFKINANSRREKIGLALAEKVGEKLRAQKQRAMNTARKNIGSPFIRSNMERLASMSPAAQQLATSKLGLGRTPIMTPSPLHTPTANCEKAKMRRSPTHMSRKPPSSAGSAPSTPKQITSGKSTLTDDLLKIPTKRLKASDFF